MTMMNSISDSIFLNSNNPIDPNLTFDDVSCYGGNDGIAYANPTVGGTAPYTYFWSIYWFYKQLKYWT